MNKKHQKITVFLPCRKGSERVPKKNIKPFASYNYGLLEIKLGQLLNTKKIDSVILSTNDEEIISYASTLSNENLHIHNRSETLSTSETSTDDLIMHALELIPKGHILWTHVTSPFITSKHYDEIIDVYTNSLKKGYDSLMTTNLIRGFFWNNEHPINYDRTIEKWPRTQTIEGLHEINSGAFLNSTENYRTLNDRIGKKPFLMPLNKIVGMDIDWEEDFIIAETIMKSGII